MNIHRHDSMKSQFPIFGDFLMHNCQDLGSDDKTKNN